MFEQKHNSNGNQLKLQIGNQWVKADYLGYESLSEVTISRLLQRSNVNNFVKYSYTQHTFANTLHNCCISDDFVNGLTEISLAKLFEQNFNVDLYAEMENPMLSVEECIEYIVHNTEAVTGIKDFGKYLTCLFEIDALLLNEDRHFRNIEVLYNPSTGEYSLPPYFDFGGSLLSDTSLYFPLTKPIQKCIEDVKAKPISPDFKEQVDGARHLYGSQFKMKISESFVDTVIKEFNGIYDAAILDRVKYTILSQCSKYKEMVTLTSYESAASFFK